MNIDTLPKNGSYGMFAGDKKSKLPSKNQTKELDWKCYVSIRRDTTGEYIHLLRDRVQQEQIYSCTPSPYSSFRSGVKNQLLRKTLEGHRSRETNLDWVLKLRFKQALGEAYGVSTRENPKPAPNKLLRSRIKSFANLDKGWDSHDAGAPADSTINDTLSLVDELENSRTIPDWVITTPDESILMEFHYNRTLFHWEFHSDSEIGIKMIPSYDTPKYFDIHADQISSFFKTIVDGTIRF